MYALEVRFLVLVIIQSSEGNHDVQISYGYALNPNDVSNGMGVITNL